MVSPSRRKTLGGRVGWLGEELLTRAHRSGRMLSANPLLKEIHTPGQHCAEWLQEDWAAAASGRGLDPG